MMVRPTARQHRRERDGGFVTAWVVAILPVIALFCLISVALWNGYTVRRQLAEMAEASARSGANGVDIDGFYDTGLLTLDPDRAQLLAFETLGLQANQDVITGGTVSIEDGRVVVRLSGQVDMLLLGAVNISVDAAAQPRSGGAPTP